MLEIQTFLSLSDPYLSLKKKKKKDITDIYV